MALYRKCQKQLRLLKKGCAAGAEAVSQYLSARILPEPNVNVMFDVEVTGLDGTDALERVQIGLRSTKDARWMDSPRLFIAIGGVPHTEWAVDTAKVIGVPAGDVEAVSTMQIAEK